MAYLQIFSSSPEKALYSLDTNSPRGPRSPWQLPLHFTSLGVWPPRALCKWNQYLPLSNWLILLSIMWSRFMLIAACVRIPFLLKDEEYTFVGMHPPILICLSVHLLIDTWATSTLGQLWRMLLWIQKYLFQTLLSVFWVMYPRNEIAGSYGNLGLIFWGTALLFSTAAKPFYIPTSNDRGVQLSG